VEQRALVQREPAVLSPVASREPQSRAEILAGRGLENACPAATRNVVPPVDAGRIARTVPDRPNAATQPGLVIAAARALSTTPASTMR